MKEIPLNELSSWYTDVNRKKILSIRKEANKRINRVRKLTDEITKSCVLLKNKTANLGDVSEKSAIKFTDKLIDRMQEINFPEQDSTNFETLTTFKLDLERFLHDVFDFSRRLVKRLDKSFHQDVREINYLLTEINQVHFKLKNFLEKKYSKNRIIESTLTQIERLESLIGDILENRKQQKEIKEKIEEAEEKLEGLQHDLSMLKENLIIKEIEDIKLEANSLKSDVLSKLGGFRRGFKKFYRMAGSGSYSVSGGVYGYLEEYSESPFETFISEQEDFPKLRSVLTSLQNVLDSNELKMKPKEQKKVLRKIEEILANKKLLEIPKRLYELSKNMKKLEDDLQEKGIGKKLSDLEDQVKVQEIERDRLNVRIQKSEEEQERFQGKIRDLKTKIQNNVKETSNQGINIVFS